MKKNEISFTKVDLPYGWLGNMSPYPIEYNGVKWRTSEALFQALRFDNEEIKELIRNEKSPMGAKMKAKKHRLEYAVVPMSDKDVENMKLCIRLKLEQHKEIRSSLLGTKDKIIIEDIGNRNGDRHKFWGAKNIDGKWDGKNMMGEIWMEMREELANALKEKLSRK